MKPSTKSDLINAFNQSAFTRPGIRWFSAAGATALETCLNRRLTVVRPLPGGVFLHRHPDGALVLPDMISTMTVAEIEAATRDTFCFGYTPGPGDTVLDIGAGDGAETLMFSRLVGPAGRVISVEAHPVAYQQLTQCCTHNRLRNVTPLRLAVSDAEGVTAIDDGTPELGSVAAAIGGTGKTSVQSVTIDRLMADHGCDRVDFLKMNIEGAEQLAIRGMADSVAQVKHVAISCHDFLALPPWSRPDHDWVATYDKVASFLLDAGFTLAERRLADPRSWIQYYVYGSR